jgi:hypothetical protein
VSASAFVANVAIKQKVAKKRKRNEVESGATEDEGIDYAGFSVKELKAACRDKGLPVGGTKAALRDRLES